MNTDSEEKKKFNIKGKRAQVFSKQNAIKTVKYLLILTPFFIGFIGYLPLYNYDYFWSAYSAVRLYGLNTDLQEINLPVELARWLAPLATAGAVITLI